MFAKRKKEEGFEWHRYVRTTIKLRREQRRQRVVEARHAAVNQMGAAGSALAAGSKAAGVAAWQGTRAGAGAAGLAAQGLWHVTLVALIAVARQIAIMLAAAGRTIAVLAQPVIRILARPNVGWPVALAAAIAVGLGVGRYRSVGADTETIVTLGVGVALLIAALPMLSDVTGVRLPRLPVLGLSPRLGVIAVAAALIAAGIGWFASGGKTNIASLAGGVTSRLPVVGGAKPLEGRAQAIGGDRLRVGSTTVRLAGIEAPDPQQRCGGGNRGRRCGAAAEAALGRLVNGRTVTCKLSGQDDAGRPYATCLRGDADIGAELVRKGHVFAQSGLFSSYSGLEREARNAKAGIWSDGEPERPAEYRAKANKRSSTLHARARYA